MPRTPPTAALSRWLDALRQDLLLVRRGFRRQPSFVAIAVLILGVTLGANAALFAFLSGYFLRPLPIARAADHLEIAARDPEGRTRGAWTLPELDHFSAATASALDDVYGAADRRAVIFPIDGGEPLVGYGALVTPEYFTLVRPRLAMGRVPWLDGDVTGPAVVLSDAGWRRLAGARPDAVGRSLRVDGVFFTIAGVMDAGVTGLEPIVPDFWADARAYERLVPGVRETYRAGGLLRDGMAPAVAGDVVNAALATLPADPPLARGSAGIVIPRPTLLRERQELAPLAATLLAMFALMTLVAGANLSGMSLARAAGRTRDLALRFALGASRARVMRELVLESLVLAGLGGALGCVLAIWAVEGVHRHVFALVAASGLTLPTVTVDWRALLYVFALAAALGVVCAVLPALTAMAVQPEARAAIGGGPVRGGTRPARGLRALVVGQAAVSVALLVAAGMAAANAERARRAEVGYTLASLVDLNYEHPDRALVERLRRDPAVAAVTTVGHVPLAGQAPRAGIAVEGRRERLASNYVDDRFFETMGIGIERGRAFTPGDAAPGVRRAIVSAAAAAALFPGTDAVGEVLDVDPDEDGGQPARFEIVGVAADAMSGWFFEGREQPLVYFAAAEASALTDQVLVRLRRDDGEAVAGLRAICRAHDPLATCTPTRLQALLDRQQVPFVVATEVVSGVGFATLALASLGLYGLVSFTVVRRTREFGVRTALGESPGRLLGGVLRGAAARMLAGIAIGLPVTVGLLALLRSRLTLLETFDARVLVLAPMVLLAAGVLAALVPARRAARVDPMVALRYE